MGPFFAGRHLSLGNFLTPAGQRETREERNSSFFILSDLCVLNLHLSVDDRNVVIRNGIAARCQSTNSAPNSVPYT